MDRYRTEFEEPLSIEVQAPPGAGDGGEMLGADLGRVAEVAFGEPEVWNLVAPRGNPNPVRVKVESAGEADGLRQHGVADPLVVHHHGGAHDDLNDGTLTMVEDDRAAEGLRWVVNLLEEVTARYQVVGGLAARAYGATRGLVDLDLYVDASGFESVLRLARGSCIWGPRQYRDEHWDLKFAKLERHGVRIELADADGARYFDRMRGMWVSQNIDFSRSEEQEVLGVLVPLMPKDQLVDYKRALGRDVDRLDLEQMGIGT